MNRKERKEYNRNWRLTHPKECREYLSRMIIKKKQQRKAANKPRPCMDCGVPYIPKRNYSIPTRCPECRQVKDDIYYTIVELRKRYAALKYTDPKEAKKLSDKMKRIEGRDFTELALNGLVDGEVYIGKRR